MCCSLSLDFDYTSCWGEEASLLLIFFSFHLFPLSCFLPFRLLWCAALLSAFQGKAAQLSQQAWSDMAAPPWKCILKLAWKIRACLGTNKLVSNKVIFNSVEGICWGRDKWNTWTLITSQFIPWFLLWKAKILIQCSVSLPKEESKQARSFQHQLQFPVY